MLCKNCTARAAFRARLPTAAQLAGPVPPACGPVVSVLVFRFSLALEFSTGPDRWAMDIVFRFLHDRQSDDLDPLPTSTTRQTDAWTLVLHIESLAALTLTHTHSPAHAQIVSPAIIINHPHPHLISITIIPAYPTPIHVRSYRIVS